MVRLKTASPLLGDGVGISGPGVAVAGGLGVVVCSGTGAGVAVGDGSGGTVAWGGAVAVGSSTAVGVGGSATDGSEVAVGRRVAVGAGSTVGSGTSVGTTEPVGDGSGEGASSGSLPQAAVSTTSIITTKRGAPAFLSIIEIIALHPLLTQPTGPGTPARASPGTRGGPRRRRLSRSGCRRRWTSAPLCFPGWNPWRYA